MKNIIVLTILLIVSNSMVAQQTIVPTGGNSSGGGGTVSFTIGQIFYQAYHSTEGSLTEGVQQPYEISVATSLDESDFINLVFNAFPNPARDHLTLSIEGDSFDNHKYTYQLYDMVGKVISSDAIDSNYTTIDMVGLTPGVFFLKVFQGNTEMKSFKIIKH